MLAAAICCPPLPMLPALKIAACVHALVENSDDLDTARAEPIEYEVRADRIFQISLSDVNSAPAQLAGRKASENIEHLGVIALCLLPGPSFHGVRPDLLQVGFRQR